MIGTIKRIPEGKKFAFIKEENSKTEFFFHEADFDGDWNDLVEDTLTNTVVVKFELASSKRGPRAASVKRI